MADDTYHPRGHHPSPSALTERELFTGSGAPTSTAGVPPNAVYVDEDNGDHYRLINGVWTFLFAAGGGGGTANVEFGAHTDPNGNVTGSVGDFYKSAVSLGGDGSLWVKQTGSGNTGWV